MNTTTMPLRKRWAEWVRVETQGIAPDCVEVRTILHVYTGDTFDPAGQDYDAVVESLGAEGRARLADALYGPLRRQLLELELELQALNAPYSPRTHHAWQVLRAIIDSIP